MRVASPLVVAFLLLMVATVGAGVPTVRHEGRPYVELDRIAATLDTRPDTTASSTRAYLRTPGHVVAFTRNWAQVSVDGKTVVLDAPVRVKSGVWLVPEMFVAQVLPRLAATVTPAASPRTAASPVTLKELRFRSYPSFTRLVLETSGPVTYRIEPGGGKEARVRVVGLAGTPRTEEVRDGFVSEARLETVGADTILRIVFEGAAGELQTTMLVDPHRLVLDFRRPIEPGGDERAAMTPLRIMVLDAGHGGADPGAKGPTGLMEKDLVLDVTRRVARLVDAQLGVKVLLSRDGDYFVPLRDRTSLANRERADLFVSIHANAHRQTAWQGVETYFLSSEATDSGARQVAALENSVVQLETPAARERADIVKAILWDLAQSEFQMESSRLAEIVQDSMTQALRIPNRGVKQAGFYVLGGAAMPAVLIEIGFVTNPQEERKLKDSRYRDEIARAIFAGLAEYKRYWDQRMRARVGRSR